MDSQQIDSMIGRMIHGFTGEHPALLSLDEGVEVAPSTIEYYLEAGRALKTWWDTAEASQTFQEKFELSRTFNRPETSYGFFDDVAVLGSRLPIMGNVQDMFYDQPRIPAELRAVATEWLRRQIREFVLRYFMRVSSFRQPEGYTPEDLATPPSPFRRAAWCPREDIRREGFGFSQLYCKLRHSGEIRRFSDDEQSTIVDLREIGTKYDWIIAKVRIFDFAFRFKPAGPAGPEIVFGLNEASYLVLSGDFISDEDHPEPGVLGRYSLGYAFIKSPIRGVIAYGPGQFDAAFESIQFRVLESGEIRVRMIFVVNRPKQIALIEIDPLSWGLTLAGVASLGLTSRLFAPFKTAFDRWRPRFGSIDPLYSYIQLANLTTAGWAGDSLCITREQIHKDFLLQHYLQHYQAVTGSLLTWRQVFDWLDQDMLPAWVVTGSSS